MNAERLASYIRMQVAAGELIEWTVVVLAGERGEELTVSGLTVRTLQRSPLKPSRPNRYRVKTILAPRDEAIDLNAAEYERALNISNEKRRRDGNASDTPGGPEIRQIRGENPRRGLLLLYPLSPKTAETRFEVSIFGVVVSFPDSGNGRSVRYRFNTVAERFERV